MIQLLKGFVKGMGAGICLLLAIAAVIAVIAVPVVVCESVIGGLPGAFSGAAISIVLVAGIGGAATAHEEK